MKMHLNEATQTDIQAKIHLWRMNHDAIEKIKTNYTTMPKIIQWWVEI